MIAAALTEGFVLGLSVGLTCLVTCGPVFFAFALRRERTLGQSFSVFGQILLGRFFGYAIFGAAAGALGGMIPESVRAPISFAAFVALGGIMIYYGIRGERVGTCPKRSAGRYIAHPVLLGFVTGLEICPPFLLALARAASLGGPVAGAALFVGFFAGTSIYILPIAFFGVASSVRGFRVFAAVLAVAVGLWFLAQGASGLVLHFARASPERDFVVVGVGDAPEVVVVSDDAWGDTLLAALDVRKDAKTSVLAPTSAESLAQSADTACFVVWLSASEPPEGLYKRLSVVRFRGEPSRQTLLRFAEFLNTYYFKRRGEGFLYDWRLD